MLSPLFRLRCCGDDDVSRRVAPLVALTNQLSQLRRHVVAAIVADMQTWGEFSTLRPDLSEPARALLYQHGIGLGFLGTTRADGGPRVHPMCPILTKDGVFAFIVPSPKQQDLLRDGRYAIHSFPCPDNEDAFYFTGLARLVDDRRTRSVLSEQFVKERAQFGVEPPADADALFELILATCLLTRTSGHGDPSPDHIVWRMEH